MKRNNYVISLDIFGTILDNSLALKRASHSIVKEQNIPVPADCFYQTWKKHSESQRWHKGSFKSMSDWFSQSLKATGYDLSIEIDMDLALEIKYKELISSPLFPESLDFINQLEKLFEICFLSNIDCRVLAFLKKKYPFFNRTCIASEALGSYKPNKKIFKEASKIYNKPPSLFIHIGDHLIYDIQGALDSGMNPIWVNRQDETLSNDIFCLYTAATLSKIFDWLKLNSW